MATGRQTSSTRPGSRAGLVVLVGVTLAIVGGWAVAGTSRSASEPGPATCGEPPSAIRLEAPSDIGVIPLAEAQVANAETVVDVVARTGRPRQAAVVALATAMQESALLNLAHGDEAGPDSRGLFQQRLQFYGGVDVMDPAAATLAFLDRLDQVPGWQAMAPADAIQSVQRAAYPELYAEWIGPASTWVDQLWDAAATCEALPPATSPG